MLGYVNKNKADVITEADEKAESVMAETKEMTETEEKAKAEEMIETGEKTATDENAETNVKTATYEGPENIRFLDQFYSNYDEEGRLLSKHGRIEFITTMAYIHKFLREGMRILEVGAGTGRYSIALAHEGYQVDALELIQHNLERLRSKITNTDRLTARQGNTLDLSVFEDGSFDITLILGPMYHLYTEEDKRTALKEAVRVTKKGGMIFVAYCMNDATIITECFVYNQIKNYLNRKMISDDFHCISKPEDLFELVRTEDIKSLTEDLGVQREYLIATDGATNYMRDVINNMDDEVYQLYIEYHLSTCERQDLIGASHHSLDILRKGVGHK